MNGFCGFLYDSPVFCHPVPDILAAMLEKQSISGLSQSGIFYDETAALVQKNILFNEDASLALACNGRIYNEPELRAVLTQKEHTFATDADTEVILHLYEEYGASLVHHLRGMFAFALYDKEKKQILCARDSFGIKPFYYTFVDQAAVFSSEIKSFTAFPSFTPALNEEALAQYLSFQYSVLPETFFSGVYKLPPAHTMILRTGEAPCPERYFTPLFTPAADMGQDEAVEIINEAVQDSVAKHMQGNTEVGAFLSSGVDSSYLAACFGGEKTFTVGFDYDNYNEIEYAKRLSEKVGAKHTAKVISTEEYWAHLSKVQYHMDEPLADPAAVALYFASREASKQVSAVLSGEGADEFFGGYNIYKEPLSLRPYTRLPAKLRRFLAKIAEAVPFSFKGKNFLIRGGKPLEERFIGNAYIFSHEERKRLLLSKGDFPTPEDITRPYYQHVKHEDDITKMQYLDIQLWLVGDILLKADKMSAAHGLEIRSPLLDREVFRAASKIPTAYRVNRRETKSAFRKAAAAYVPQDVASRRKLGFPVPIRLWLREDKYAGVVARYFTGDTARRYFNGDELNKLLKEHKKGKKDNSRKIWTVFMFLLWHEAYFG
jgi:asparagine synthase (glutamine-hydrolysing)